MYFSVYMLRELRDIDGPPESFAYRSNDPAGHAMRFEMTVQTKASSEGPVPLTNRTNDLSSLPRCSLVFPPYPGDQQHLN